jgi:hypothetical protein
VLTQYEPGRVVKTLNLLIALVVANLVSTASPTFAFSIRGRQIKGIIQKVDAQARDAELLQPGKAKPLRFTWDQQTKVIADLQFVDAAMLRPGASVEIIYYHPFFGDPYVTKVTLLSVSLQQTEKTHVKISRQGTRR